MDRKEKTEISESVSKETEKKNTGAVDSAADRQSSALDIFSRADDLFQVRRVVAGNPNTPISVLSRLCQDDCESIRKTIACNPKTTDELLTRLSCDKSVDVRLSVAENPNASEEILGRLAADAAVDVRYGLAENPHMPESVLIALAKDENPYVRCRALKTLRMLAPEVQSKLFMILEESFRKSETE